MTFVAARPPVIGSKAAPGIRASLRVSKSGVGTVSLIVSVSRFPAFSGSPIGRRFDVRVGRAENQGLLRIEERDGGAFTFTAGIKGSAVLKLDRWDLLPTESRSAEACTLHGTDGNALLYRLPSWAQPAPRRLASGAGV